VMVDTPSGIIQVSGTDNPRFGQERQFKQINIPADQVWAQMQAGGVLVSEPLANRLNLAAAGSTVTLSTPIGPVDFKVTGIFYDYSSSEGSLFMALDVYRRIWADQGVTAVALRLGPGQNPEQLAKMLQDQLSTGQRLLIRSNQTLREDVMAVFDRTFAITSALRLLATVVAFIGVLNTLLLLQLEKQREIGILRALGLTQAQMWGLTMLETGLMGLAAGILAMPTGYVLSLILVYVINRRSFGWTLQMSLSPEAFLQGVLISVVAALVAGIYPAWRMGRRVTAEALRNE
jgi:putative ABC transport system permease protein